MQNHFTSFAQVQVTVIFKMSKILSLILQVFMEYLA